MIAERASARPARTWTRWTAGARAVARFVYPRHIGNAPRALVVSEVSFVSPPRSISRVAGMPNPGGSGVHWGGSQEGTLTLEDAIASLPQQFSLGEHLLHSVSYPKKYNCPKSPYVRETKGRRTRQLIGVVFSAFFGGPRLSKGWRQLQGEARAGRINNNFGPELG